MVMRRCELCASPARMYCESDQASLCWDCDFKVHGANFLVARHSRTLLCHGCQSLTPWSANGHKLGPTVSMCRKCCGDDDDVDDEIDGGDVVDDINGRDEVDLDGGEVEEDDDDGSEDEGDNQVVPWSTVTPTPPSPSCSSSDEEFSLKRNRKSSSDLRFQENNGCSIRRKEINLTVETNDSSLECEITRKEKVRTVEPGEIADLIKPAGIID